MRPIFILGCDRSGTTLLGAMLGSHRDHVCVPECQFVVEVFRSLRVSQDGFDPTRALKVTRRNWRFGFWKLDPYMSPAVQQKIGGSYSRFIEWLVREYAKTKGKERCGVWVDHTPTNFRYAATLRSLFPDARFIHIVRDGRGVAASIMPLDWGPNTIMQAAHWWTERLAFGLAAESCFGPGSISRVHYEDLIRRPKETLRTLSAELGIEFTEAMIEGKGFQVPRYSKNQHELVGSRPVAARADAWKNSLTRRQIAIFEAITADLLAYLGYKLVYGLSAAPPTASEEMKANQRDFWRRMVSNPIRRQRRSFYR